MTVIIPQPAQPASRWGLVLVQENSSCPINVHIKARSLHPKYTEFIRHEKKFEGRKKIPILKETKSWVVVAALRGTWWQWFHTGTGINTLLSQAAECILTLWGSDEPPRCRLFWGRLLRSIAFALGPRTFLFPTGMAVWPSHSVLHRSDSRTLKQT